MENKKWVNVFLQIFLIAFLTLIPVLSFGQGSAVDNPNTTPPAAATIQNPLKNIDTLEGLIKALLEGVLKIGIPVVALVFVYSGFLFVFARGKPEEIKKAKDAFLYTLVGTAVLLGAWALTEVIKNTIDAL